MNPSDIRFYWLRFKCNLESFSEHSKLKFKHSCMFWNLKVYYWDCVSAFVYKLIFLLSFLRWPFKLLYYSTYCWHLILLFRRTLYRWQYVRNITSLLNIRNLVFMICNRLHSLISKISRRLQSVLWLCLILKVVLINLL